jgi:4-amino-4-deoxy-L-arabinose transferase-like glycosyltransferase
VLPLLGAAIILGVAFWALTYRLGAFPFLDDPNEGQYAEVAREMVESGEWMSPHLNYVLFLNKPPLSYWAIAASYTIWGVNEAAARLPSAVAAFLTVALVLGWGWWRWGPHAGCLAAAILFSMGGFFVESHEVRPDLWLVLGLTGAIASLCGLLDPRRDTWQWKDPALLSWQVATALGLLAKGMIGVVVSGAAILTVCVWSGRWRTLFAFLHPRAWWLLAAIMAPWHIAMSLEHSGFLWDYVVNQHLLFFFDQKFPRDSEPISLGMFWAAFAMRAFPWTPLLPLALLYAVAKLRRPAAHDTVLLLAALAATLGLFSLASSRLEHYSLPALPFAAMLLAKLFCGSDEEGNRRWRYALTGHLAFVLFVQLNALWVVPRLLRDEDWLQPNEAFVRLALKVFALLVVTSATALLLARRRFALSSFPIAVAFACVVPLFCDGLTLMAPGNSVYPLVQTIRPHLRPDTIVVYEAPVEYQTVASLNFYLQRKLEVLGPEDFIPPTYLVPYVHQLFIDRKQLADWWREKDVIFITDPLTPRDSLDGVVPGPFVVLGRDSVRWAVRNSRPNS